MADYASEELKNEFPSLIIECSGGVTEANLAKYCLNNVDVVSVGRLTQGYQTIDLSFKILKEGRDPSNPLVN